MYDQHNKNFSIVKRINYFCILSVDGHFFFSLMRRKV